MLPELPPSLDHWLDNVMLTFFAAFAGFMGYLMRTVTSDRRLSWARSILEGMASAVVGYIVILACRALNLSYEWTGVIVGTLGWLGATVSIQIVEKLVIKKLGLDYDNRRAGDSVEVPKTSAPVPPDSSGT